MEQINFQSMDRLRPTIEQARMCGLIKEAEEIQYPQENQLSTSFIKGMLVAATIVTAIYLVFDYMEKKERSKF